MWMRIRVATLAAVVALVAGGEARAAGKTYQVAKGSKVSFVAKITGSSFEASSEELSGDVSYDPTAGRIGSGSVSVKSASLETGLGLRDRHMHDKYLEAKKYPAIEFVVKDTAFALKPGTTQGLAGTFVIKGAKKAVTVPVKVESDGAETVLSAEFPLDITDYGIPQPGYAVVKMDTVLQVTLKLVLRGS